MASGSGGEKPAGLGEKLLALLPTGEKLAGLQGVEAYLRKRRYRGRLSFAFTIVFAVAWVCLLAIKVGFKGPITWASVVSYVHSPELLLLLPAIACALIWLAVRYTGVLFKEAREPFRYTFCIADFKAVDGTPGDRFKLAKSDQLKLLRHDLAERLNLRVRRFSYLEHEPGANDGKKVNLTSHIHVEGDYAIREDREEDEWSIHVWTRIRVGPVTNAFSLAFPVRYALELEPNAGAPQPNHYELSPDQYGRLLERVYSSVATEIYKQIQTDLADKILLFPTSSLRALARYTEAEDFENSNTIDAYDRALHEYKESIDHLSVSWLHRARVVLGPHLPAWLIGLFGIRGAMRAEAKVRLGYSRCLLYRRLASEMAGRERNSIFVVRGEMGKSRRLMCCCYNSVVRGQFQLKNDEDDASPARKALEAKLTFPDPAPWRPWRKASYGVFREELCEAYAISALGAAALQDRRKAKEKFLPVAEALDAKRDATKALLFFVKAEVEPRLVPSLDYLSQAKKLVATFEMALYRFAYYSDLLARDREQITPERVKYLCEQYDQVLRVNPGNIASFIGQGYLLWLADDLDKAEKRIRGGIELQKVVSQTFVGDLKYMLGRIKAERAARDLVRATASADERGKAERRLNEAVFSFEEAVLADPAVAAGYSFGQNVSNNYYFRINSQILDRYRRFAGQMAQLRRVARRGKTLSMPLDFVYRYVLNDYANACLNYYVRFDVDTQRDGSLKCAIRRLKWGDKRFIASDQSQGARQFGLMIKYNLFCALSWPGGDEYKNVVLDLVNYVAELPLTAAGSVLSTAATWKERAPRATLRESSKGSGDTGPQDRGVSELNLMPRDRGASSSRAQATPSAGNVGNQYTEGPQKAAALSSEKVDTEELKRAAKILFERTNLAPLANDKDQLWFSPLVSQDSRRMEWSRLNDSDMTALLAVCRCWISEQVDEDERRSRDQIVQPLCARLLSFWPEHYEILSATVEVSSDTNQIQKYLTDIIDAALLPELKGDPQNTNIQWLVLAACDQWARKVCNVQSGDYVFRAGYERAIKQYEKVGAYCQGMRTFHANLAAAYANRIKQLEENNDSSNLQELREKLQKEQAKLTELDGQVDKWNVAGRLSHWQEANGGGARADQAALTLPIEVHVATDSLAELGITQGLPDGLKSRVEALRVELKKAWGYLLPGINFKDDRSFDKGRFRVFERGVPGPVRELPKAETQENQWDCIVDRIRVAALHAIEPYEIQIRIEAPGLGVETLNTESFVAQYAAGLCRDLGLPVQVTVRVKIDLTVAEPVQSDSGEWLQMWMNKQRGRPRRWPHPFRHAQAPSQIAEVVAMSVYENREFLIDAGLAERVAGNWKVYSSGRYWKGWTADTFRVFLTEFVKRNVSVDRGQVVAQRDYEGPLTDYAPFRKFEQAIEEANGLHLGVGVKLSQSAKALEEYQDGIKAVTTYVAQTVTVMTPEVCVETANELAAGKFQFKINDVSMPVLSCLRPDEMVIYGASWQVTDAGIANHSIADAISGFAWTAAANDEATKAKCGNRWPTFDEVSFIKTSLNYALREHAGDWLASPTVGVLVTTKLRERWTDTANLLQRAFGGLKEFPLAMTVVLRRLLDEQVPICDLPGIVERLAAKGNVKDEADLNLEQMVEAARLGVRALALQYATDDGATLTLRTDHLAPGVLRKDQLVGAADVEAMRTHVWNLVKDRYEDCVLVVTPELRAYVRELLRLEFPNVAVLREAEIAPEIRLTPGPSPTAA